MATNTNELWQFALLHYDELKDPLLGLQAKGIRVNWVLAALWLASQSKRWHLIDDAALIDHHERVIKPFRVERMRLKAVDEPAYERAKSDEIELEKIELQGLYCLLTNAVVVSDNDDLFADNLSAVIGHALMGNDDALKIRHYFQR